MLAHPCVYVSEYGVLKPLNFSISGVFKMKL